MTIDSITASGHTLTKNGGIVSCNYLNVNHSTAQGGALWYAGANSTDGGTNSGWLFSAAPPSGGGGQSGSTGLQANKSLQNLRSVI